MAAAAGVSVTTASAALSRTGRVSESTRLKVQQAAQSLGYRADTSARHLRATTDTPPLIGMVFNPLVFQRRSTFVSEFLMALLDDLATEGIALLQVTPKSRRALAGVPVDALVVLTLTKQDLDPDLLGYGVPIIATHLSQAAHESVKAVLYHRYATIAEQSLDYLRQQGSQQPALLRIGYDFVHINEITDSYQQWCREHDVEPRILTSDRDPDRVRAVVAKAQQEGADGFLDTIGAVGPILDGLRNRSDVPIIAMSGDQASQRLAPFIDLKPTECAHHLSQTLLDLIRNTLPQNQRIIEMPYELRSEPLPD
ncbi:MAG: LacI family DNA-binding transcriptional regulator [Actinobacteria bacterium]|nr:LacI family DNA-binding transcriptional regulator [Actinomycetota bacterium]